MNVGVLTKTNVKGQVVIPKAYREALSIDHKVPLQIVIKGSAIHIYPVKEIVREHEPNKAYIEVLKRTQGSWGSATKEELLREKKQKSLELETTKKMKKAW